MAKDKITFKANKPTGRYRSFQTWNHDIKLNGEKIGYIPNEAPHKVHLMVVKKDIMEDNNQNCSWKWINFKKENQSVDEAKQWLIDNLDAIKVKYTIYQLED